MADSPLNAIPQSAGAATASLPRRAAAPAALAVVAALGATIWIAAPKPHVPLVPQSAADLADTLITPVDPANAAAVAAAVSALQLPHAQRIAVERAVADRGHRIGWIVLTDSIDPDGDAVSVEAAGIVQHVVLSKAWTPVAVPLGAAPGVIGITAVRDGGGGGVTVALATRSGVVPVRNLLPGERVEVVAP